MSSVTLVPARTCDVGEINKIIERSKCFWKYDVDYLAAAIPLLRINEAWMRSNIAISILKGDLVGFAGIEPSDDGWDLEHFWIDPPYVRQGIGKAALKLIFAKARENNVREITLTPDPPAEGFYSSLGAVFTGEIVSSRVTGGPRFRKMIFQI